MSQLSYALPFVAPIPIGHRVELTCCSLSDKTLWLITETKGMIVRDLETGIVYSPDWVWECVVDKDLHTWHYDDKPAKGLRHTGVILGEVTSCRVISRPGNAGNHRPTTMLTIESGSLAV